MLKPTRTISQKELVRYVSDKTDFFQKDIQTIFEAVGEALQDIFLSVGKDESVEIKLFEGLRAMGVYAPERIMPNNIMSHVPLKAPENVIVSARFSHTFREKIKAKYRAKNNINTTNEDELSDEN